MEDTVRYWGEVAGVGAPSWSSADPMQGQDCKITASSHLSEPEKQEGLRDVIAERAGVLGQTALGSNPGHASY